MNEAMPPVQPLTPQPSTPATPSAPKPPLVPPQAPPKPPAPPAPPSKPTSVPPEPSVRPDPTPHDPALQPHPEKKRHWLTLALIALIALILGGFAFLLVWPRLAGGPLTQTATSTANGPAAPDDTGTIIPPEGNGTTTTSPIIPATTTMPVVTDQPIVVTRGGTDVWFEGDEKTVRDPKTGHQWKIRAVSFGDSRCPVNVVCVWAGERTVTLDVTDLTSGRTERVTLGTSRTTVATVLGLKLTLIEIDDGKGGVYAEIKAE